MRWTAFRYLTLLLLITEWLGPLSAQEQEFSFSWNNRNAAKQAGKITIGFTLQPDRTTYLMDIGVSWFDPAGNQLTDPAILPYLYLSSYELEWAPAKSLVCASYDQKGRFELYFQDKGRLIFLVKDGFYGGINFILGFQYALTRQNYLKGDLEKIKTERGDRIELPLIVQAQPKSYDNKIEVKNPEKDINLVNFSGLTKISDEYKTARKRLDDFIDRKNRENIEERARNIQNGANSGNPEREVQLLTGDISSFINDIEIYLTDIEHYRSSLSQEGIPRDTINAFSSRYSFLREEAITIRSTYFRISMSSGSLGQVKMQPLSDKNRDSLMTAINSRYCSAFSHQMDSLQLAKDQYLLISEILSPLLRKGNKREIRSSHADSLIQRHRTISAEINRLREVHRSYWTQYRYDIAGMDLIPDVENLHADFSRIDQSITDSIQSTNQIITENESKLTARTGFASTWAIWTGIAFILILTILIAFRNSSQRRKLLQNEVRILDNGTVAIQPSKGGSSAIYTDGMPEEFFTVDLVDTIPESIVGKVQYSFGAIKTIYQLIHGAFLEKKPGNFGGYLFGNQYKLNTNGNTRYEVFIEKVCSSKCLRAEIINDMNSRADLVDEMDEMVRQNKKYLLVGWFTSSGDSSLEMKEGLMKVHRTFFKEKWQLGITTNSGSEDLTSAVFLKRRSGYFDPYPDPASFIRIEEMYRYSINPPANTRAAAAATVRNLSDYCRLSFNPTWTDTVVQTVFFNKRLLHDLENASSLISIPVESYQIVGFLYGGFQSGSPDSRQGQYEIYVDRFVELTNETTPREIPGFALLGWWAHGKAEIFNYLPAALSYHEQNYREPYQMACLVKLPGNELRIFTRKSSLEMNNSVIETEEFNLSQLV